MALDASRRRARRRSHAGDACMLAARYRADDAPHEDRRHHRPASRDPRRCWRMVEAGMDVARLNYSHGTPEEHAETRAPRARRRRPRRPARRDPAGPARARSCGSARCATTSPSSSPATTLTFALRRREARRRRAACRSPGPGSPSAVEPDDGASTSPTARCACACSARARATARSTPRSRSAARSPRARASTSPARSTRCPSVPEEDLELLRHGESIGVDLVALSFVRRAEDIDSCASTRACR